MPTHIRERSRSLQNPEQHHAAHTPPPPAGSRGWQCSYSGRVNGRGAPRKGWSGGRGAGLRGAGRGAPQRPLAARSLRCPRQPVLRLSSPFVWFLSISTAPTADAARGPATTARAARSSSAPCAPLSLGPRSPSSRLWAASRRCRHPARPGALVSSGPDLLLGSTLPPPPTPPSQAFNVEKKLKAEQGRVSNKTPSTSSPSASAGRRGAREAGMGRRAGGTMSAWSYLPGSGGAESAGAPRTRQAARSAWTGARRGFGGRVERSSTLYFFSSFFSFFFFLLFLNKPQTDVREGRCFFYSWAQTPLSVPSKLVFLLSTFFFFFQKGKEKELLDVRVKWT